MGAGAGGGDQAPGVVPQSLCGGASKGPEGFWVTLGGGAMIVACGLYEEGALLLLLPTSGVPSFGQKLSASSS
jgi:hypothetical protein